MNVKDLWTKLKDMDPKCEVLCYCEDESLSVDKHGFKLFEIAEVELTEAEMAKGEDGIPMLKFDKTRNSKSLVLISITSDF